MMCVQAPFPLVIASQKQRFKQKPIGEEGPPRHIEVARTRRDRRIALGQRDLELRAKHGPERRCGWERSRNARTRGSPQAEQPHDPRCDRAQDHPARIPDRGLR